MNACTCDIRGVCAGVVITNEITHKQIFHGIVNDITDDIKVFMFVHK